MDAKKCDVCGKFFLPYMIHDEDRKNGKLFNRMNIRSIDSRGYFHDEDIYELCEDCSTSLNKWLKNQGVYNNAEAR